MEMIELAVKLFFAHAILTVPVAALTAALPFLLSGRLHVWALIALGVAEYFLIPNLPGVAQQSDGLAYIMLIVFVPFYILIPYGIGSLARSLKGART